ncbi:hypothetical protein BJY00DRAFT_325499 [Aspergillus carlsbadensis]|nr:hypothetical protein BJY00DRAFT_325499 [Aspergillus carlsbadensis]
MSWTDPFFFQWTPLEWINSANEEEQRLKLFPLRKTSWVFWLAINYRGSYLNIYVAKVAESQRRRIHSRLPTKKLQSQLDPYMKEARALYRIENSCPSSQKIYFPKFYGVVTDLDQSQFSHGYFNRRAVVLEAIRPKLASRRLIAATQEKRTAFRSRLNNLGTLTEFEKEYYTSFLIDRTKRLSALHNLGITHGDIKDDHFRLPGDYHDTVLYDFSCSYTFSPETPYLVNLRRPRSLREISNIEQQHVEDLVFDRQGRDLCEYLVESTVASVDQIMAAFSQPLEGDQLELMIVRVKTRPDVNSIFPFLESIRPLDDPTWHIRRSQQLPLYNSVWVFSAAKGGDRGDAVLVIDSHLSHASYWSSARP